MSGGIFNKKIWILMTVGGVWSALANIGLFVWALQSGRSLVESMTMVFVSLTLIQFFKAYNFRSDHYSVLKKPFANKWLNRAVIWELGVLLLVVYIPFLQIPFKTFALSGFDWVVVVFSAVTVIPVLETTKWILRKQKDK